MLDKILLKEKREKVILTNIIRLVYSKLQTLN